jgi:uncharacterized repeat protein (TIGR03803 family)
LWTSFVFHRSTLASGSFAVCLDLFSGVPRENFRSPSRLSNLVASPPGSGSIFAGWGGACTGTGTCSVTMTTAAAVTAAFNFPTPVFTVLHTFQNNPDGGNPQYVALVQDSNGNLYGTTLYGGSSNVDAGTVFELSATGELKVLYSFMNGADGGTPYAGVILDGKGNLYGTTEYGGSYLLGTVFKLSPEPTGGCPSGSNTGTGWCETVVHSFAGNTQPGVDGANPYDALLRDTAGNLYGTTYYGGDYTSENCGIGCGTAFGLEPSGNETFVYELTEETGQQPRGGLIEDAAGNLYGTATSGGPSGFLLGLVFEIDNTGNNYEDLYAFSQTNNSQGMPQAGMIMDTAGNLYGTTLSGGQTLGAEGGTVFMLDKASNDQQMTILHNFGADDGQQPVAGLFMDRSGNLYGTTESGSTANWGTVYELIKTTSTTNPYTYKQLYVFTGQTDGGRPLGDVFVDAAGNIYGTASQQGDPTYRRGTVYKISQPTPPAQ